MAQKKNVTSEAGGGPLLVWHRKEGQGRKVRARRSRENLYIRKNTAPNPLVLVSFFGGGRLCVPAHKKKVYIDYVCLAIFESVSKQTMCGGEKERRVFLKTVGNKDGH